MQGLYLDKLLGQLAYPLGLSLTLCLLGLLLLALGRRRWGLGTLLVAVVWLGVWSLPAVSDALRQSLEGRFANLAVAELPVAEAAVVLGGAIDAGPPGWPYPDLGSAADRVWQAARIYHAGKAKRLILSGGRLAWQGERLPEAQAMGRLLADLGVPAAALVLEERSRNTRENALYSAELIRTLGIERVLLVTSALHMPRALASFRAAGVAAIPAPTDFEVMPQPAQALRWLPDAGALAGSTRALKEYLGWWVYWWRGWA
ncbi:YdcF family protein [Candidatus Thiodictyon syntrophicum]|jgi:uncharacterized SAM-binding protein YcdF (DUF218 family)|uniref:DUF218 domain-containing protein n=1 Tax=Candidatus Thiodictyon syntrophicum TaxID=1166950 RepID=A0A2K8UE52_9GAMM|nr:YdcF family protein [Candidatus Thiodictyon syntrophicum]AUB83856.1 hypothetical protein THSYN_24865 [Candidatus Thiodictyon syntrophicum]